MRLSARDEAGPSAPRRETPKASRMCSAVPRLCPDIPLCTRALGPPEVPPAPTSEPRFPVMSDDVFDMEVEHAPAVGVHRADGDVDPEPTWDSVDDAMATLAEAQRAFSQQREFRHQGVLPRGGTLQVVPRAVATTPPRPVQRVEAPAVPNTWPPEKPALGLRLDSEAVIRQMQKTANAGSGAPGWTSPPQQPEAMPPSMRLLMPMEQLQSDHLVSDLFGAQAQAAMNGSLLNGQAYSVSPPSATSAFIPAQQTGAAPCPVELNEGGAFIVCDNDAQLGKGIIMNGTKVQAVMVNGGSNGVLNGRPVHDDDIIMSEG